MPNLNGNIRIELDDLVRSLSAIIQHLKTQQKSSVEIGEDYYWEIDETQLYNPAADPNTFTLGQLSHDWERVSHIMTGTEPPLGYTLVWLGNILRAIGHKNVG